MFLWFPSYSFHFIAAVSRWLLIIVGDIFNLIYIFHFYLYVDHINEVITSYLLSYFIKALRCKFFALSELRLSLGSLFYYWIYVRCVKYKVREVYVLRSASGDAVFMVLILCLENALLYSHSYLQLSRRWWNPNA